jgi:hypothetical protein
VWGHQVHFVNLVKQGHLLGFRGVESFFDANKVLKDHLECNYSDSGFILQEVAYNANFVKSCKNAYRGLGKVKFHICIEGSCLWG